LYQLPLVFGYFWRPFQRLKGKVRSLKGYIWNLDSVLHASSEEYWFKFICIYIYASSIKRNLKGSIHDVLCSFIWDKIIALVHERKEKPKANSTKIVPLIFCNCSSVIILQLHNNMFMSFYLLLVYKFGPFSSNLFLVTLVM